MGRSLLVVVALLATVAFGADHDMFKDCSRTFCNTYRNLVVDPNDYYRAVYMDITEDFEFVFNLTRTTTTEILSLVITPPSFYDNNFIYRLEIDNPDNPRYRLQHVLNEDLVAKKKVSSRTPNYKIEQSADHMKVHNLDEYHAFNIFFGPPFVVEIFKYKDNEVSVDPKIVFNASSLSWDDESGNFAFDVSFPDSLSFYGLFHHADSLQLQETVGTDVDPYRLRNLDTWEYEVNSTMALYGSSPALYAHSHIWTGGVFLHNAAELWVDTYYGADALNARFMAEAGALDLFVLLGPDPVDTVRQFDYLTGRAHLPQLWTLGYHQCRWTYWNQETVVNVVENFDEYDIPVDAIWLDDGYSDGNRYLVWNKENFTDPIGLQVAINATNRKLVVISDPHIKVDNDYFIYSGARQLDIFVKYANYTTYEGNSWPGLVSYIDFLDDIATEFYANLYSYTNFVDSTDVIAGIWNDMNEPSVDDETIEKTFPPDLIHSGRVQHRVVHNIYGLLQTRATHLGLIRRDNGAKRPFILTRSTFSGSQRYAAMWTGDNTATWDHLAVTYSECLTANILGQVWCGADVGAFHNVPDDELAYRWFQSAAWLPFYRGHAEARLNPEPPSQEPYAYPEEIRDIIKQALVTRYSHLPQWYRLFYEHTRFGDPVIRPLFYEYPDDMNVNAIDQQLLLGSDILVRHVAQPNVSTVSVYLPGTQQYWFRAHDNTLHLGPQWQNVQVTPNYIPVYYRAGSIIVRKNQARRSTKDGEGDPFDLYVYLNTNQRANGTLYYDDYTSFRYRDNKEYGYFAIEYHGDTNDILFTPIDSDANPPSSAYLGTVTIYRIPTDVSKPVVEEVYTHTMQRIHLGKFDITAETKGNKPLRISL